MKYIRNFEVFSKEINKTWYILETNKKTMRELNEVASVVWDMLKVERSIDELVNSVCQQFAASPSIVEKDIQSFVNQYVKEGYINIISS